MDPYNTFNRQPKIEMIDFVLPDPKIVKQVEIGIMHNVINFVAARARAEALASAVIELEFQPELDVEIPLSKGTMLDRIRDSGVNLSELVHLTLEESK